MQSQYLRFIANLPYLTNHEPSRTGSKIKHFRELHKQTGLPYSEMVSFSQRRS